MFLNALFGVGLPIFAQNLLLDAGFSYPSLLGGQRRHHRGLKAVLNMPATTRPVPMQFAWWGLCQ
jgi:hypothetical protein